LCSELEGELGRSKEANTSAQQRLADAARAQRLLTADLEAQRAANGDQEGALRELQDK
jgi:hypothetical protein